MIVYPLTLAKRGRSKEGLSATRVFLLGTFVYVAAVLGLPPCCRSTFTTIDVRGHYGTLFTLLVVAIIVRLMWRFWPESPWSPQALFLFVALAFMLVVAFGPGYGPQYALLVPSRARSHLRTSRRCMALAAAHRLSGRRPHLHLRIRVHPVARSMGAPRRSETQIGRRTSPNSSSRTDLCS